ncbi:HNH endonuclease family protein [Helicobacter sp. T3_23-1056]
MAQNWLENLNDEEATQIEQVYAHTFGNLTLIEKGVKTHKKVDNSPLEKLQFLSESSSLHLNSYFSVLDSFDLDCIKSRSEALCKRFLEVEIFKDCVAKFRSKSESNTLKSSWTYFRPTELVLPSGEVKKVKTYKNVAREIISYLLAHYKDEIYRAMENVDFIKDNDEKKSCLKEGSFVFEDFGDFAFYCKAEADMIRKHLKTLVDGVNNEDCKAEHFEIRGYIQGQ